MRADDDQVGTDIGRLGSDLRRDRPAAQGNIGRGLRGELPDVGTQALTDMTGQAAIEMLGQHVHHGQSGVVRPGQPGRAGHRRAGRLGEISRHQNPPRRVRRDRHHRSRRSSRPDAGVRARAHFSNPTTALIPAAIATMRIQTSSPIGAVWKTVFIAGR